MNNNYQLEMDKLLSSIKEEGTVPKLLLHACCAPCASYVLEYLTEYFDITVLFCNPNITEPAEYKKRADELMRLISVMPKKNNVSLIIRPHQPDGFYSLSKGLETVPEGGVRCFECYRLRLEETAAYMKEARGGCPREKMFSYFATTLTVSPHKNAAKLNEIGLDLAGKYGVNYLPSDFKKREGYKRSIELSRLYGLYRQDFCGCEYSRNIKYGNN